MEDTRQDNFERIVVRHTKLATPPPQRALNGEYLDALGDPHDLDRLEDAERRLVKGLLWAFGLTIGAVAVAVGFWYLMKLAIG
jgi:hypothetical protein